MAPYPTSTWTRTNTDNVTVVDADYMDDSDGEITAIEASLGVDLVPGTTAPLVDYLRVRDDTSSVNHVFLAHSEVSDTRVSIGPVDLDGTPTKPATPLGKLHIRSGASGVSPVSTGADDLVIENDGSAGMTILAPNTGNCNLYMSTGTGGQPRRALMRYNSTGKTLLVGTSVSGGALQLLSGDEEPALDIDGDQNATFAGNVAVEGNVAVAGDRVGIETMKTHGSIGAGVAGDIVWAKDASNDYYIFVSDGTLWNGVKLTETSS